MRNATTAAASIRQELKLAFPGIKFSVKTKYFAGGNSVDVRWTDGPTDKEVNAVIGKYQDGHFDGMDDCYRYDHNKPATFGSAKYICTSRHASDDLILTIASALGIDVRFGFQGEVETDTYEARHELFSTLHLSSVISD